MSYSLHQFAFQYYPYIAVAVLLIGSWARYDRAMYTAHRLQPDAVGQGHADRQQLLPHRHPRHPRWPPSAC